MLADIITNGKQATAATSPTPQWQSDRTPLIGPPATRAWAGWSASLVRELGRREHIEGGVGAVGVVLVPPVGHEDLRFEERVELLDGEQLVAHAAAVGLDPR